MKGTLDLVKSTKRSDVQEGLDLSLQLYKLLPQDYYVENRIIQAYIFFAQQEVAKKNWRAADEWAMKGLRMRFHIVAMQTHLDILIGEAKDFIKAGDKASAIANLNDVLSIVKVDNNATLFAKEKDEAIKLLATLK